MMNNNINNSISCTVCQCQNHAGAKNYCTLNKISVGTHEQNPTQPQCTDCQSFVLKK